MMHALLDYSLALHDHWLLWLIQEIVYAHGFAVTLVLFLLACLPQRLFSVRWLIIAPVNILCVLCLTWYGAWTAAPGLAFVMLGFLMYQVLRSLYWRARAHDSRTTMPRWLRLPAWPMERITRAYLKLDPRAVYWLDLARAERGLAVTRTAENRRQMLQANQFGPVRTGIWRLWLALAELRIWVLRQICLSPAFDQQAPTRLARLRLAVATFYRVPQEELALREPHLAAELKAAAQRAAHDTILHWTGRSFREYFERRPQEHVAAATRAAEAGRRWMWHREAWAEMGSFHEPWKADDVGLEAMAQYVLETWRLRRQYDHLWYPSGSSAPRDAEVKRSNLSVPNKQDRNASSKLSERKYLEKPADEPVPAEEECSELPPTRKRKLRRRGAKKVAARKAVGNGSAAAVSDEELFAAAHNAREDNSADSSPAMEDGTAAQLTVREQELLANLNLGCRLLVAYLGVPAQPQQAELEKVFRAKPEKRRAVLWLVGLQLLSERLLQPRHARHSRNTMDHWRKLLKPALKGNRERKGGVDEKKTLAELSREFVHLEVDVLHDQQAYAYVREQLIPQMRRSPQPSLLLLLADAEAKLSMQVSGQPELQAMLRHDAIDHYFEAEFPGIWTFEVARFLVDNVHDRAQLRSVFAAHQLTLSGGGEFGLLEQQAPVRAKPSPPPLPHWFAGRS